MMQRFNMKAPRLLVVDRVTEDLCEAFADWAIVEWHQNTAGRSYDVIVIAAQPKEASELELVNEFLLRLRSGGRLLTTYSLTQTTMATEVDL